MSAQPQKFRCHSAMRLLRDQQGVALLTVMMLMLVMGVVGIASISLTALDNRMAGFMRIGEAATGAAEGCLDSAVKILHDTIQQAQVDPAFDSPGGPVVNRATLQAEILGQNDNNADDPSVAPNTTANVNNFVVSGDIDRLYAQGKAGGSLQFAAGYEGTAGGAAGGGVEILYRIDCVANNAATNASSRVTAVYACTATGDTCQRKI